MKNHVYLFILLGLLNIGLCLGLLHISRKYNHLDQRYKVSLMQISERQRQKEDVWYSHLSIDEDAIATELLNLGGHKFFVSPQMSIAVFVPPGFCGICLDSICQTIKEIGSETKSPVVFFVPSFKYRDIRVRFADCPWVAPIEYDYEALTSESIANTDKIILFHAGNSRVQNIIFADKENPEWTRDYFKK